MCLSGDADGQKRSLHDISLRLSLTTMLINDQKLRFLVWTLTSPIHGPYTNSHLDVGVVQTGLPHPDSSSETRRQRRSKRNQLFR